MILRLAPSGLVEIDDAHDLTRLEVRQEAGLPGEGLGDLGWADNDGQHIWLIVDQLRSVADPRDDPTWQERFGAMVSYASSKGWLDADGRALRAHLVNPSATV